MPFCHNCGAALEPGAPCSACSAPTEKTDARPARSPFRSTIRKCFTPAQPSTPGTLLSGLLHLRRLLTLAAFLLALFIWASPRDDNQTPAGPSVAPSASAGTAIHTEPAAHENSAGERVASPVVAQEAPRDHVPQEDGRVYSVALIVATPEIPPGAKLFAQGRVLSFDYADAMRSRRYAIIEDEQQPGKRLMCAMRGEEGAEVFSLYHAGEVVAVSGEYLDTAGYDGWPRAALTNCHVAGPQDNVVRPIEIAHAGRPASSESRDVSPTTTPATIEEPLSFDDALDQCLHAVRQHFPKLSVWPGPSGFEETSRRLYQQNDKRLLLPLEFDPGMGMDEGNGVATCDVQTSRVTLKSIQLGITRYDYNDDGSVAQKSGWTGWQKGMQPIENRTPQSTPGESIPTQQPPLYGTFEAGGTKGGFGVTGGGDFGTRFGWYVQIIQRKVSENWLKYQVDPSTRSAERVHISFDVARDGHPFNVQVKQSSGVPALDIFAVSALQRIDTFGPLPPDYSGSKISVEYWFEYK
jgi:TonB family protein